MGNHERKEVIQYQLLKQGIDNKTLDSFKKNKNIILLTVEILNAYQMTSYTLLMIKTVSVEAVFYCREMPCRLTSIAVNILLDFIIQYP